MTEEKEKRVQTEEVALPEGWEDGEDAAFLDLFPEGTRIVICGNRVTFENLTPDLLDVARSLNPDDETLFMRASHEKK